MSNKHFRPDGIRTTDLLKVMHDDEAIRFIRKNIPAYREMSEEDFEELRSKVLAKTNIVLEKKGNLGALDLLNLKQDDVM